MPHGSARSSAPAPGKTAQAGTATKRTTRPAVRYVVGIDLGTTNTVVAYANSSGGDIELFEIDQLMSPGQAGRATLLPSLRYHPAEGELSKSDMSLPWPRSAIEAPVTGNLARRLGAQVPGRMVASAKSWLSHAAVDRSAAILPWGAASDVEKVSPVEASASYLAHVRAAWNQRFPRQPLEQQDIVLTVPASFDDGARELTLRAARLAGLEKLKLIEEPQAALYDWLFRHRSKLDTELAHTRQILVCDVGGGTTDLSLIDVRLEDGEPVLTRTGVGNHLMLGGDNMDLVLAHMVESRMASNRGETGDNATRLSAGRLFQLMERCRAAKEQLLAPDGPEQVQVTLLGSGSKLIGSTRSAMLTRTEVFAALVDGFFPVVDAAARPAVRRTGLVEFGLPYASDGAVTRHLAAFLAQHGASPDTLLLNGGVFRADALSQRLQQTLAGWRAEPLRLLENDNPDVAVARGAVAYALSRHGLAPRIGGGSARSYFLLLDEAGRSPSAGPRSAICVLPRGSEPGLEILLANRSFALRTGKPVRFHLVCSTQDGGQQAPDAGQLVQVGGEDFEPLPPVATVMDQDGGIMGEIPVQLSATLTELGTLELVCVASADSSQRWLLEFQLRVDGADAGVALPVGGSQRLPPNVEAAIARIDRVFGPRQAPLPPKEVRQLRLQLESLLGSRERWPSVLLRQLFDALWQRARGRRRSADHERLWLNLAGFCLRPGYGHTLDDWRVAQCWSLFENGVQHSADREVASQWWTLWRRIAGGLEPDAQVRLLQDFAFNLQAEPDMQSERPRTLVEGSIDDMLRLAATLERIPGAYKAEIGTWIFTRIDTLSPSSGNGASSGSRAVTAAGNAELARLFWALGRIGARVPFYGSAHDVVDVSTATTWLTRLLEFDWKRNEPAGFAAAHIARLSGDRLRDLPLALRQQVMRRLGAMRVAPAWVAMVAEVVTLDEATERQVLGEALPPGLKLLS